MGPCLRRDDDLEVISGATLPSRGANGARVMQKTLPFQIKRARGIPDARCIRGLACKGQKKLHTSIQGSGGNPTFPRAMVLRLTPSSPWRPGLFATIAPEKLSLLRNLTPASGRQDHAASPYALAQLVLMRQTVHRVPHPTSVTIAIRPSWQGRDGASYRLICVFGKTEIFLREGLDRPAEACRGKSVFGPACVKTPLNDMIPR